MQESEQSADFLSKREFMEFDCLKKLNSRHKIPGIQSGPVPEWGLNRFFGDIGGCKNENG